MIALGRKRSLELGYRQFRLMEEEIAEIKERDKYFCGRFRYESTGRLEFAFTCRDAWQSHTWRDGKAPLEDQLVEIASAVLQAPIESKRRAELKRREEKRASAQDWCLHVARHARIFPRTLTLVI